MDEEDLAWLLEDFALLLEDLAWDEEDFALLLEDFTWDEEDLGWSCFWLEEDFVSWLPFPLVTFNVSVMLLPSAVHVSVTSPTWNPPGTVAEMVNVFALASYLQSLSWMNQAFQDCLVGWLLTPETVTGVIALPCATVCVREPVPPLPGCSCFAEELSGFGCSVFCDDDETTGLTLAELELATGIPGVYTEELLTAMTALEFGVPSPGAETISPSGVIT